jgi:cytochrome oxidase Cu insertion factor (SCO1/SenC/PrrC family)
MRIAARIALLLLAVALVVGLLWALVNSSSSEEGIGKPAPVTQGTDADGVAFQLSDYHGKVVLLDFWADW